jgi:hypothetical protein
LSAGIFPDVTNCKKFFVCTEDGAGGFYPPEDFECDNYYVFDPNGYQNDYCRFTRNRNCVQVNCQGQTKNILIRYPTFPSQRGEIVASCRGSKKPFVFRCEAGFLADLQTLPVECKLNCRGAGKFPYEDDSTKYVDCVFTGRRFEPKVKSCFRNYYFDRVRRQCMLNPTTAAPATTTTAAPGRAI